MKRKITEKNLLWMYETMLRIRACEESFVGPISNGQIKCPVHLYTGQEAVASGVAAALKPGDYVFGNHRSHGHYLARGGDLRELVAEVYCKETGCARGRGGSMHVCDPEKGMLGAAPIVAGTISLATGSALASKLRGDGRVTVSFFGDGAAGEGALYESLNFAALKKLPILFACENNLYSTHMSIRECRPDPDIAKVGVPFGVRGVSVDGNNVLEVYDAAKKAVESCRRGKGPAFIEFKTYRMRGHVGPDDNIQGAHTDIRPNEEVEQWKGRDPIDKFEKYLVGCGIVNEEEIVAIRAGIDAEIEEAHVFAVESPYPLESEMERYVYR